MSAVLHAVEQPSPIEISQIDKWRTASPSWEAKYALQSARFRDKWLRKALAYKAEGNDAAVRYAIVCARHNHRNLMWALKSLRGFSS